MFSFTSLRALRRRCRDRGQALVELALILPILLLLVAGAIDLGRAFYTQVTITNAAREGALEAALNPDSYDAGQPCADDNRVVCRAIRETNGSFVTVDHTDVTMECHPAGAPPGASPIVCVEGTSGSPNTAWVTVSGDFSLVTPLLSFVLGGQDVTLQATAKATIRMTPTIGAIPVTTPTPAPTASPTPTPSATPAGPTPTPGGPTPTPTPTASPTPTPTPCVIPTASFTASPASGKKNTTVFSFTNTSQNIGAPHCNPVFAWSFGDGAFAASQDASHIYDKKGNYTITLVVSNTAGASTQFQRTVNVTN